MLSLASQLFLFYAIQSPRESALRSPSLLQLVNVVKKLVNIPFTEFEDLGQAYH